MDSILIAALLGGLGGASLMALKIAYEKAKKSPEKSLTDCSNSDAEPCADYRAIIRRLSEIERAQDALQDEVTRRFARLYARKRAGGNDEGADSRTDDAAAGATASAATHKDVLRRRAAQLRQGG